MRTVNQATSTAWSEISYTKVRVYIPELELSIPDENISSIKFTESISDEDCLFFVGCISSGIDLTLENFLEDIHLNAIEVYVQRGNTTELKIFTGKIYTADLDKRNNSMHVVAYDALYRIFNADVTEWYENLVFPMTMKNFRDAFFERFNVTQNNVTLLFDTMNVDRAIGGEEILGRDIIKPLCEANLVFGHIDYDGNFSYLSITQNNRTVANGEVDYCLKTDYVTEEIDKVIVRMDEEDIGATSGYGSNAYIVEGNMFFYGLGLEELQDVADDIFDELEGFSFQPLECSEMYNPIYELGDLITVNSIQTIILNRTTDFQRETIKANGLSEYSQAASYTNSNLIALLGKTNRLHRDINETRSTISDVARGLETEIVQTAEGLQIQITDLQAQIDGETAYYERESGEPTLLNYPYWDFTTSIPCNNTIRTAEIYTENMELEGEQFPHFTYTEKDRKDHRSDLCYVDDSNMAYRFVLEEGVWYWKEIADSDYTQILSRLSILEATAEQLTTEYTEIRVDLQDNYWTKVETQSKITQTANQIQTTVAATYATKTTTNSLQSQITQTASSITAEVTARTNADNQLSSRITQNANAISAKVSQSGGNNQSFGWELTSSAFDLYSGGTRVFRCNSSGIEIKGSGTFSGSITASSGSIAGWTISGNKLTGGRISIDSGGSITATNAAGVAVWSMTSSGTFYASNVDLTGRISADSGNIGNWSISNGSIENGNIKMQADGNIVCYSGSTVKWALKNNGDAQFSGNVSINGYATAASVSAVDAKFQNLNASNITSGTLNAARIAGGSITGSKIAAETINVSKLETSGGYFNFGGTNLSVPSTCMVRNLYLYDDNTNSYRQIKINSSGYVVRA